MNKKLILLALIGVAAGVAAAIFFSPERKVAQVQELFPADKLKGYVQNTHIKVVKTDQVGGPLTAVAVTPYGIKPEQVSPTGYGALKALHQQFGEADWLAVYIAEDSAMAEASNWVGLAEYFKGAVTVTGGLPTKEQLDSASKLGQPLRKPGPADLKVAAAVFDSAGDLSAVRWELSQNLLGSGRGQAVDRKGFFDLDYETTSLHAAAKALGKPPKEVQATLLGVTRYYWLTAGQPL